MDTNKTTTVAVIATETAPYHKPGKEYFMNAQTAEKMINNGWGVYSSEMKGTQTAKTEAAPAATAEKVAETTTISKTNKKTTNKKK